MPIQRLLALILFIVQTSCNHTPTRPIIPHQDSAQYWNPIELREMALITQIPEDLLENQLIVIAETDAMGKSALAKICEDEKMESELLDSITTKDPKSAKIVSVKSFLCQGYDQKKKQEAAELAELIEND